MKYRCLRDCYVNDRLFEKGEAYNLPDDMRKAEANFKLMDQPISEPESGAVEVPPIDTNATSPVKPDVPIGHYWCTKCKTLHRETGQSRIGKRHLQYKG